MNLIGVETAHDTEETLKMATVSEKCPSCGTLTAVHIGQAITFGESLVWSRSASCTKCGFAVEADGSGFPPQIYREAILHQDGIWSVVVAAPYKVSTLALVLKDVLELERTTALKTAKAIPGRIWEGSEAEVEWLRRKLAIRGIIATYGRNNS